jgi:hypothetical protein
MNARDAIRLFISYGKEYRAFEVPIVPFLSGIVADREKDPLMLYY